MASAPDPTTVPDNPLVVRCIPTYRVVVDDCGLIAAYLYGVLSVLAGPHGAVITLTALAIEAGLSQRTVIRHLRILKSKGWLNEWHPVGGTANRYTLTAFPR
jgi:hypothetical protein